MHFPPRELDRRSIGGSGSESFEVGQGPTVSAGSISDQRHASHVTPATVPLDHRFKPLQMKSVDG
jgi:hypothetical protein